jgi:hypothetical protein
MSDLDNAMYKHMIHIILSEQRPFSYKDFLRFSVGEKEYSMKHGTFRNKISKLIKSRRVQISYYSSCAFYSLMEYNFGKTMTRNHTVVHNDPLYKMIQDIPFEKQSIHDIRLRLKVPNIWQIFAINTNFHRNKRSEDIVIPTWNKDSALVRTVIHKTDTVSVSIGCSLQPIPLDAKGIINFFNLLVRVEGKLQSILDNSGLVNDDKKYISIPEYRQWTVTMWHFGRDASVEYMGERFCISVEKLQHVLTRIYVKDFNGKNRIRIEKQEYPKKTLLDAIEEKLDVTNCH